VTDPLTNVQYLDISLQPNRSFEHEIDSDHTGFIYVFEGEVEISNTLISEHSLAVLGDSSSIKIKAGEQGARMIFVTGNSIKEPIVQQGPFVMNSNDEIHQAMRDYRDNKLVQKKAVIN
jgi:redox-sensitive bicupin YhaK (pirin superfamily)